MDRDNRSGGASFRTFEGLDAKSDSESDKTHETVDDTITFRRSHSYRKAQGNSPPSTGGHEEWRLPSCWPAAQTGPAGSSAVRSLKSEVPIFHGNLMMTRVVLRTS